MLSYCGCTWLRDKHNHLGLFILLQQAESMQGSDGSHGFGEVATTAANCLRNATSLLRDERHNLLNTCTGCTNNTNWAAWNDVDKTEPYAVEHRGTTVRTHQ